MRLNNAADFVSLFQLGVALNLGFGALISFGEPLKQRTSREISQSEVLLNDLILEHNTTDEQVASTYAVARSYLELRHAYFETVKQWRTIDSRATHIAIAAAAIISFLLLFICSVEPGIQSSSTGIFVTLSLFCNGIPIVIALTHLALSVQLRTFVDPKLTDYQSLLKTTLLKMSFLGAGQSPPTVRSKNEASLLVDK